MSLVCKGCKAVRGFSLIELVIVVVIIGIMAAIAIPRLSRGTAGAADSAVAGDLAVLRIAIDNFAAEHNGTLPSAANILIQFTMYTDVSGASGQTTPDATHIFGPYLRSIPTLPVGARKGNTDIGGSDGPTIGWIYSETTGTIAANSTTEADATGKFYNSY